MDASRRATDRSKEVQGGARRFRGRSKRGLWIYRNAIEAYIRGLIQSARARARSISSRSIVALGYKTLLLGHRPAG